MAVIEPAQEISETERAAFKRPRRTRLAVSVIAMSVIAVSVVAVVVVKRLPATIVFGKREAILKDLTTENSVFTLSSVVVSCFMLRASFHLSMPSVP